MRMTQLLNPVTRHLDNWAIAPRKGGGGGTSTTTSTSETTVDEAFVPYIEQGLTDLQTAYDSGDLSQVAGVSDLQNEVFNAASGTANTGIAEIEAARGTYTDAMNGTGMFDPAAIDELERAAIDASAKERGVLNDTMSKAGLMGGSRAAIAAGDQDAQLANALASIKYDQLNRTQENAMWGASSMSDSGAQEASLLTSNLTSLADLGGLQRSLEQEQLDGNAKGLENYLAGMQTFFPVMTGQEQQSTTQSSNSGGK